MKHLEFIGGAIERESDSLAIYFKEIKNEPALTSEEEGRLAKESREGSLVALDKMVKANLRFVVSVALYYRYSGLSLQDLIAEGNIGLLKAVNHFDETRGFKFISYAVFWIRQSIMAALSQHSRIIRLPGHMITARSKITGMFHQLEQQFGQEPTLEELSAFSDVEIDVLKEVMQSEVKLVSIDAPIATDESESLLDITEDANAELPDRQLAHQDSLATEIGFLLHGLNGNQTAVVKMYYGLGGNEPISLTEIGVKMGVSKERIRQIKDTSLTRMKARKQCRSLEDYFGL